MMTRSRLSGLGDDAELAQLISNYIQARREGGSGTPSPGELLAIRANYYRTHSATPARAPAPIPARPIYNGPNPAGRFNVIKPGSGPAVVRVLPAATPSPPPVQSPAPAQSAPPFSITKMFFSPSSAPSQGAAQPSAAEPVVGKITEALKKYWPAVAALGFAGLMLWPSKRG